MFAPCPGCFASRTNSEARAPGASCFKTPKPWFEQHQWTHCTGENGSYVKAILERILITSPYIMSSRFYWCHCWLLGLDTTTLQDSARARAKCRAPPLCILPSTHKHMPRLCKDLTPCNKENPNSQGTVILCHLEVFQLWTPSDVLERSKILWFRLVRCIVTSAVSTMHRIGLSPLYLSGKSLLCVLFSELSGQMSQMFIAKCLEG